MPEKSINEFLKQAYSVKNTKDTKKFYAHFAENYDELLEKANYQQPIRCADKLRQLIEPENQLVLDIGCGTGLSGRALKANGFTNLDGCDLSSEMLTVAKSANIYNMIFTVDMNKPPIPVRSESYDAALCVGCFSFGHVQAEAMDEVLRILKPGGVFVLGFNDHYFQTGALKKKLDALVANRRITAYSQELGDHIAGVGSVGWVVGGFRANPKES